MAVVPGTGRGGTAPGGVPRREGADVPLSEEEQRILQELEQQLYEQDRGFLSRVRRDTPGYGARRAVRWAAAAFVAGFAVVIVSFRTSLLLGTFGFLVMLFSALLFERSARLAYGNAAFSRPQSRGERWAPRWRTRRR